MNNQILSSLFVVARHTKCRDDTRVVASGSNFAKYSPILNLFTGKLGHKRFLIWILTIPPHRRECHLCRVAGNTV